MLMIRPLCCSRIWIDGGPGAVERAFQVDRDDRVPLRLGHVEDHPVAQDAGHVDQDIDPAEAVTTCWTIAVAGSKSATEP